MKFVKEIFWRLMEPIILGSLANMIINYVFDPDDPDFIFSEFLAAWILCIPITELNRLIDHRLERRFSWTRDFKHRFLYHLFYLTLSLAIILNLVGNIYVYLRGDSFYSLKETAIINAVTFALSLVLTASKWTVSFYKRWRTTEIDLHDSVKELDELKSVVNQHSKRIELQRGKSRFKIAAQDLRVAKSEFGIVRVSCAGDDTGIFSGTLSELAALLPEDLFFVVGRNVLIHKEMIKSVSSSTFGKVLLTTHENEELMVSRQKASSFRKWFNSGST